MIFVVFTTNPASSRLRDDVFLKRIALTVVTMVRMMMMDAPDYDDFDDYDVDVAACSC